MTVVACDRTPGLQKWLPGRCRGRPPPAGTSPILAKRVPLTPVCGQRARRKSGQQNKRLVRSIGQGFLGERHARTQGGNGLCGVTLQRVRLA
jgi:hypothetical protein